jgi:RNA ligase (TIGR02306 family)
MSSFKCEVVSVSIIPHPNADALEIAQVKGYQTVVGKNQFITGDVAVYIPEGSILPTWLIEKLELVGRLSGNDCNRVSAIRLRGVVSQGLLYKIRAVQDHYRMQVYYDIAEEFVVNIGDNVAPELGIQKYLPHIPPEMDGKIINIGKDFTIGFDVEDIKQYPDVLIEGEHVRVTEKIHGTFCGIGILPQQFKDEELINNRIVVFSKSLGDKGQTFTRGVDNIYTRAARNSGTINYLLEHFPNTHHSIFILGEVFGSGSMQDLKYGLTGVDFRAFDGVHGWGRGFETYDRSIYLNHVKEVPVLYEGPYSHEIIQRFVTGKENVTGKELHIREGVVIRPVTERSVTGLNRVILRSVSDQYLGRKGGTEYQ